MAVVEPSRGPFSSRPALGITRKVLGDVTNLIEKNTKCVKCQEDIRGVVCRTPDFEPVHFGCSGFQMKIPQSGTAADFGEAPSLTDLLDKLSSVHPPLVFLIHSFFEEMQEFYHSQLRQQSGKCYKASPDYMISADPLMQSAIKARAAWVNWFLQVSSTSMLDPDVMHLAVTVGDRYLSRVAESPGWMIRHMSLVMAASARLALKFETPDSSLLISYPWAAQLGCSQQEITKMETEICGLLDYQFMCPKSTSFLKMHLNSLAHVLTELHHEAAPFLVNLFLLHPGYTKFSASQVACAALLFCNELLGREAWPAYVAAVLQHSAASLRPCVEEMRSMLATTSLAGEKLSSTARRLLQSVRT